MWTSKEFLDVLQAHLLPQLQAQLPHAAAHARQTCIAWHNADALAMYPCINAHVWNHRDISSLAQWLAKQSHVGVLEISTADQELGGMLEKEAAWNLAQALPSSCTSLQLTGGVALPLLMLKAAQLPDLTCFKLRSLPGKWTYTPGMFPWEPQSHPTPLSCTSLSKQSLESLELEERSLSEMGPLMYGPAVYKLNSSYWISYLAALHALVAARGPSLRELNMEVPARCLGLSLVTSLAMQPAAQLRDLRLCGFGSRGGSHPQFDETRAGLCITALLQLSSTLTHLELGRCGIAPCPAAVLEGLTGLQTLSLAGSILLTTDRPPDLRHLVQLTQLNLKRSEWFDGAREPWPDGFKLHLPTAVQSLDLTGFESPPAVDMQGVSQLTSLADLHPLSLSISPSEAPEIYQALQSLTTCRRGIKVYAPILTARHLSLEGLQVTTSAENQESPTSKEHQMRLFGRGSEGGRSTSHWNPELKGKSPPAEVCNAAGPTGLAVEGSIGGRHAPLMMEGCSSKHDTERVKTQQELMSERQRGVQGWTAEASTEGQQLPWFPALSSLDLVDCQPQVLCKHLLPPTSLGACLTRLAFSGELEDEEEAAFGLDDSSSDGSDNDYGDVLHCRLDNDLTGLFSPSPGQLPQLRELHLSVGTEGYQELDLRQATALTLLLVDNCEYVDLQALHLPTSLVHLNLGCWYGLPELYVLNEGDPSVPASSMPARAKSLEARAQGLFEVLVSGLPLLQVLKTNWNVLTEGTAALKAHLLQELSMRWVRDLPPDALDLLDLYCPQWQTVLLANGKRKYTCVAPGLRHLKQEAAGRGGGWLMFSITCPADNLLCVWERFSNSAFQVQLDTLLRIWENTPMKPSCRSQNAFSEGGD